MKRRNIKDETNIHAVRNKAAISDTMNIAPVALSLLNPSEPRIYATVDGIRIVNIIIMIYPNPRQTSVWNAPIKIPFVSERIFLPSNLTFLLSFF